ncbi:hypothetical protein KR222_000888, partial [Zaprionus bogoriensis]
SMSVQATWIGFLALLLLSISCHHVSAEFYSSADKVQQLERIEKEMVAATRLFLDDQQEQLKLLGSFVELVKREYAAAKEQYDDYWAHPLQVFRLAKRIVIDWEVIHEMLKKNEPKESYRELVEAVINVRGFPKLDDLRGTARGILRLQKIYNLTVGELADGHINGVATEAVLLWRDCLEIGVQMYEVSEYRRALEWLTLASKLLEDNESDAALQQSYQIYEYLALTNFELGEKRRALRILANLRSWQADHTSQHAIPYLQQTMPKCPEPPRQEEWFHNYTQLCQGKLLPQEKPSGSSLRCYRDTQRHVLFRLAPLNVEEVHRDPDIFVFHNVLSEAKIEAIFKVSDAITKFRSSVVGGRVSDIRVSQQVWVNYSTPIMQTVSRLVSAISGLDMNNSELMQVADYGVGGQYIPHLDAMHMLTPDFKPRGNRISTNMFYLSDVLQGGYTVFPKLNVYLKPTKGALVMWYNLHKNLEIDTRTQHAGCPVLEGAKRIGNVWIHTTRQEFRRPCSLKGD